MIKKSYQSAITRLFLGFSLLPSQVSCGWPNKVQIASWSYLSPDLYITGLIYHKNRSWSWSRYVIGSLFQIYLYIEILFCTRTSFSKWCFLFVYQIVLPKMMFFFYRSWDHKTRRWYFSIQIPSFSLFTTYIIIIIIIIIKRHYQKLS